MDFGTTLGQEWSTGHILLDVSSARLSSKQVMGGTRKIASTQGKFKSTR